MVKVYNDNTLQKISMANIYLVCSRGSYYADSIGRASKIKKNIFRRPATISKMGSSTYILTTENF